LGERLTEVRQAFIEDLELVVPLFDAYRQFYRQRGDVEGARRFLTERFVLKESIVLLAMMDSAAVGFTQLYPSFSSGAMARIFILNDLFVVPQVRRTGVGSALLRAAAEFGRRSGALRLVLSTEVTNTTAKSLYADAGWKLDTAFRTYQLQL
jgi:GNAT superfamily N-acetyltransferase